MCGRYVSPEEAAIERAYHIGRHNNNPFRRRFNVLPTTNVPILRHAMDMDGIELTEARWGLIPHWWSKPRPPISTINARSEEAAGKPMWKHPYLHSRCLIPAIGWYEWKELERIDRETGEVRKYKQPFYLWVEGPEVICFAGLMSAWNSGGGLPQITCAILTRAPSESAAEVHDRMPVILPEAAHGDWLNPQMTDADKIAEVIRLSAIDNVKHHPVNVRLNAAKTDDAGLIEPLTLTPTQ
jgi:putative SOS response-associated peptidase YedK